MGYKAGSFDADKFKEVFGLTTVDEGDAYTKGSSTGSKQVAALGTYMTKQDYNRLKDSDEVWDAYAAINGKKAMEKKREGGDMSINTLDALMDDLSAKAPQDNAETKEPFQPVEKSEDHLEAEANYDKHFENGNPWDTTSAVQSYETAFARAAASGRELSAGDYLRQRADDKKGGVNRFTHFLKDSNTLGAHEGHRAAMNAIKRADHVGLQPPELIDPGDLYDKYKKDIDDVD